MKKAVQKKPIFQKEVTQFVINSKHTVAMGSVYKFKGHIGGTFLGVLDATKRRGTTRNHLGDVFHFNSSRMKSILNDFIIVFEIPIFMENDLFNLVEHRYHVKVYTRLLL